MLNNRIVLIIGMLCFAGVAKAQAAKDVNQFIQDVKVKTFDCPNEDSIPQVEKYLASTYITDSQRFQLQLEKTHWQICQGNYADAEVVVDAIIANPVAEHTREYYALAVYQKGFLFDVNEDPRRCDYYQRAKALSLDKFDDISLSSELGLMTYCSDGVGEGQKLIRLFEILKFYSQRGDAPTIAHIHNNIGLIYGQIGQHVLAAEQFQKTFELGFPHYRGANKYASLISVFTSFLASGEFGEAEGVIKQLDDARNDVDVPLVHAWYYYAKGRYYLRLDKPAELQQTVIDWKPYLAEMDSSIFSRINHWFEIQVCINEKAINCISEFVKEEENNGSNSLSFLGRNVDYLELLAKAYSALGEIEKSRDFWMEYGLQLDAKLAQNTSSGKVLGVANLYSKISELESTLEQEQRSRVRFIIIAVTLFLLALFLVALLWRKKQAEALSYDSVSSLLNNRAAIAKISKVPAPAANKVNALALFDLANFKEVNRILGSSNADDAIKQIALIFKNITRESDILGRFAPEQFILCLPDIEEESAKAFFERIRFALEHANLGAHRGIDISVNSSMSIYLGNDAFSDLDDVLDDLMLSLSKKP